MLSIINNNIRDKRERGRYISRAKNKISNRANQMKRGEIERIFSRLYRSPCGMESRGFREVASAASGFASEMMFEILESLGGSASPSIAPSHFCWISLALSFSSSSSGQRCRSFRGSNRAVSPLAGSDSRHVIT